MKSFKGWGILFTVLLILSSCSFHDRGTQTTYFKEEELIELELFIPKAETAEIFEQLITEFEEQNPNIRVNQVIVPDGMIVLKKRIARGDLPDIFVTYPIEQDYIIRAKKGYLLDLTNESFIQEIEPEIQFRYLVDGKMYGVALTQNAVGVLYNKTIFQKHQLEVPKTWDEFINTLEKLQSVGEVPILMANNDPAQTSVFNLNLVANQFPPSYWEQINDGRVKISEDPEWRKVAEKMLEIVRFAESQSFEMNFHDVNERFASGYGAMYVMGTWALPLIKERNPALNFGIFPFPANNAPLKNKVLGGVDIGFSIAADTRYPEEAKKFLEFLVKKENAQRISYFEGSISTVKSVNATKGEVKLLAEYIRNGQFTNWPNHYWIGGTSAESDFRKLSWEFFKNQDIEEYLRQLDHMFQYYNNQYEKVEE